MRGRRRQPCGFVVVALAGLLSAFGGAPAAGDSDCASCHRMDPLFSHPVGVQPRMAIPSALPLDQGRIACTTCHDDRATHRQGDGPMLRPELDAGSCSVCHASRGSPHGREPLRAHFLPSKQTSHTALDVESSQCLACHDGSAARDVGGHYSDGGTDHPIGVPYRDRRGRDSEIRLVEEFRLDPRVRLFGDSVGCGSCHSVYSRQDQLLVMSNLRSRLCLSCHVE